MDSINTPESLSTLAQSISGVAVGAAGAAATGGVSILNTVNVRAFLQLLMSLTDTNVLSTPQVLAADNQKAKIVVGENRPFPTGQAQGITGGTLVTIERKDVGVTLEFTPQVLENDLIRLEIKQEITAIEESVAQTIGSGTPHRSRSDPPRPNGRWKRPPLRKINRQSSIGGLVRDNIILNERKVPFLGDIPFLGWLFRFQSRATEKLNLLVFLTPTLVRDEADMVELNARKSAELGTLQRENRIEEPTKLKQDVLEKLERPNGTPRPLPNTVDPSAPLPPPVRSE